MKRTPLLLLAALLSLATLAGCGFAVRGAPTLPFSKLFIQGGDGSAVQAALRQNFAQDTQVQLVGTQKEADAVLEFGKLTEDRQILSLSGSGKVREFQLVTSITYRLRGLDQQEWLPTTDIQLKRDYSYSDTQILAKEQEETRLRQDIASDAAQQILRRLSKAVKPPPRTDD